MTLSTAQSLSTSDFPEAVALLGIVQSLNLARRGVAGVNPTTLITEGGILIRTVRPADHSEWVALTAAAALFWAAAATFQPRLAAHEIAARQALKAANVTIRGGRG